jgi:hypothetical protein
LAFPLPPSCPTGKSNPLKTDFENINNVIASINQNVQDSLNKICYPVDLIDQLANGKDNAVLDFAISKARDTSWATAVIASNTPNFLRESVIGIVDYAAAKGCHTNIKSENLTLPF